MNTSILRGVFTSIASKYLSVISHEFDQSLAITHRNVRAEILFLRLVFVCLYKLTANAQLSPTFIIQVFYRVHARFRAVQGNSDWA